MSFFKLRTYIKTNINGSSCSGSAETNLAGIRENAGLIPYFRHFLLGIKQVKQVSYRKKKSQWVKDLALLCLWHRPEAAALIPPVGWEPPYAEDSALKKTNKTRIQMHIEAIRWLYTGSIVIWFTFQILIIH